MPFSSFGLHPDLMRGVKEMGFSRPTPIQKDTIPPAMEASRATVLSPLSMARANVTAAALGLVRSG